MNIADSMNINEWWLTTGINLSHKDAVMAAYELGLQTGLKMANSSAAANPAIVSESTSAKAP